MIVCKTYFNNSCLYIARYIIICPIFPSPAYFVASKKFLSNLQKEKRTLRECSFSFGRGIRIRTLNNGVRDAGLLFETHSFKPNFKVSVSQKSLAYRILNVEKLKKIFKSFYIENSYFYPLWHTNNSSPKNLIFINFE